MTRWKAAGIHLSISLVAGVAILAILLGVWYPPPYFHAGGGDKLSMLLIGIDIALGPLLTLIVYRAGKPGIAFDLSCIAVVQAIALAYGLWVMVGSRPVFLVAAVDRLLVVSANELDDVDLAEGARPEFRELAWTGPRLVGAQIPADSVQRNSVLFSGVAGKDIEKFPRYYVDYATVAPELLGRAEPLPSLANLDQAARARLDEAVRLTGKAPGDLVYVPLIARKGTMIMLLDRQTGEPLRAADVTPW